MKIGAIVNGEDVYDGETAELKSFKQETIAEVTYIDNDVLKWNLRKKLKGINLYENFSAKEVLSKFKDAAKIFLEGTVTVGGEEVDIEKHKKLLCLSTGLPVSVIDKSTAKLGELLTNIEEIIKFQIPNHEVSSLENGYYTVKNKTIGWIPEGKNLFVMTPSNHPNVNYMWVLAAALGYPIIIRPSIDDPFTPCRLVKSLLKAGLPKENFQFYPTGHEVLDYFIDYTDKSILFGGNNIKNKYESLKKVKVFGPGNSSVVIDENYYSAHKDEVLNTVLKSMLLSSGRGCINASYVYFKGNGRELAENIAAELQKVNIISPLDTEASIAAFKSKEICEKYNKFVEQMTLKGYKDITNKDNNRMVSIGDEYFLRPTILYIDEKEIDGDDAGMELTFPFVTFVDNCSEEALKKYSSNSLSISYLSDDKELFKRILRCKGNGKLFVKETTNNMEFSDPHEGFISSFLYIDKALKL